MIANVKEEKNMSWERTATMKELRAVDRMAGYAGHVTMASVPRGK